MGKETIDAMLKRNTQCGIILAQIAKVRLEREISDKDFCERINTTTLLKTPIDMKMLWNIEHNASPTQSFDLEGFVKASIAVFEQDQKLQPATKEFWLAQFRPLEERTKEELWEAMKLLLAEHGSTLTGTFVRLTANKHSIIPNFPSLTLGQLVDICRKQPDKFDAVVARARELLIKGESASRHHKDAEIRRLDESAIAQFDEIIKHMKARIQSEAERVHG